MGQGKGNIFRLVRVKQMERETFNEQDQSKKEMFLNNYPFVMETFMTSERREDQLGRS